MAAFDPRVGDVQAFLRSVLERQCTLQGLPKYLLFVGRLQKTVAGFCGNRGLRIVGINMDDTLEEQLVSLWHEIFHIEVAAQHFGTKVFAIQTWWEQQSQKFYHACHDTELCLHEQYADNYSKSHGQDLNIDNAKCTDILSLLLKWESDPYLIYRLRPDLPQIEEIVRLAEENFRAHHETSANGL